MGKVDVQQLRAWHIFQHRNVHFGVCLVEAIGTRTCVLLQVGVEAKLRVWIRRGAAGNAAVIGADGKCHVAASQ
jgi:hypothetical protein